MAYINALKPTLKSNFNVQNPNVIPTLNATLQSDFNYVPTLKTLGAPELLNTGVYTNPAYLPARVRSLYPPKYNYNYTSKKEDPKDINSLADVFLGIFGDMNRFDFHNDFLNSNRVLTSMTAWLNNVYVKPFTEENGSGFLGVLGNVVAHELGEDFDVLNNIVKGLAQNGWQGFLDNFALGGNGRVQYSWNTGNLATDVLAEIASDPMTWVEVGVAVASWFAGPGAGTAVTGLTVTNIVNKVADLATNRAVIRQGLDLASEAGQKAFKELLPEITQTVSKHFTADVVQSMTESISKNMTVWNKKRLMHNFLIGDNTDVSKIMLKTLRDTSVDLSDLGLGTLRVSDLYGQVNPSIFKTHIAKLHKGTEDTLYNIYKTVIDNKSSTIIKGLQKVGTANEQLQRFILKAALPGIYIPYKVTEKVITPNLQKFINSHTIKGVFNKLPQNELGIVDIFKIDEIENLTAVERNTLKHILQGTEDVPSELLGHVFVKKQVDNLIHNIKDFLYKASADKNYSLEYRNSVVLNMLSETLGIKLDDIDNLAKAFDEINVATNFAYKDIIEDLIKTVVPTEQQNSILIKTAIKKINTEWKIQTPFLSQLSPEEQCKLVRKIISEQSGMTLEEFLEALTTNAETPGQFDGIINKFKAYLNPEELGKSQAKKAERARILKEYGALLTDNEVADFLEKKVLPLVENQSEDIQKAFIGRILDNYIGAKETQKVFQTKSLNQFKDFITKHAKVDYTLNYNKRLQKVYTHISDKTALENLQAYIQTGVVKPNSKRAQVLDILNKYITSQLDVELSDVLSDLYKVTKGKIEYLSPLTKVTPKSQSYLIQQILKQYTKNSNAFNIHKAYKQLTETVRKLIPPDMRNIDDPVETYIKQLEELNKKQEGFYDEVINELRTLKTRYEDNIKIQQTVQENFIKNVTKETERKVIKEQKKVIVSDKKILESTLTLLNKVWITSDVVQFKATLESFARKGIPEKNLEALIKNTITQLTENADTDAIRESLKKSIKELLQDTEETLSTFKVIEHSVTENIPVTESIAKILKAPSQGNIDTVLNRLTDKLRELGINPTEYIIRHSPEKQIDTFDGQYVLETLNNTISDLHRIYDELEENIPEGLLAYWEDDLSTLNDLLPIFDKLIRNLNKRTDVFNLNEVIKEVVDEDLGIQPLLELKRILGRIDKFRSTRIDPKPVFGQIDNLKATAALRSGVSGAINEVIDFILNRNVEVQDPTGVLLKEGTKYYIPKLNNMFLANEVIQRPHYMDGLENIYQTIKSYKDNIPDLVTDDMYRSIEQSVISIRAYNTLLNFLDFLENNNNKGELKTILLDILARDYKSNPAQFLENEWKIHKIIEDVKHQHWMLTREYNSGMDAWRRRTGRKAGHLAVQDIYDMHTRALTDENGLLKPIVEKYSDARKYSLIGWDLETTSVKKLTSTETSESAFCVFNEKPIKEGCITFNGELKPLKEVYTGLTEDVIIKGNTTVYQGATSSTLPEHVLHKLYVKPYEKNITEFSERAALLKKSSKEFIKKYVYPNANDDLFEIELFKPLLDKIVETHKQGKQAVLMTCNGDNFDITLLRKKLKQYRSIISDSPEARESFELLGITIPEQTYQLYLDALNNTISFDILKQYETAKYGELFSDTEYDTLFNVLSSYFKSIGDNPTLMRLLDGELASNLKAVAEDIRINLLDTKNTALRLAVEDLSVLRDLSAQCNIIGEETFNTFKEFKRYNRQLSNTFIDSSLWQITDIIDEFGLDFSQTLDSAIVEGVRKANDSVRMIGYNSYEVDTLLHYFNFEKNTKMAPKAFNYYADIAKSIQNQAEGIRNTTYLLTKKDIINALIIKNEDNLSKAYGGFLKNINGLSLEEQLIILSRYDKEARQLLQDVRQAVIKYDEVPQHALTYKTELRFKQQARSKIEFQKVVLDPITYTPETATKNLQRALDHTISELSKESLPLEHNPVLERIIELQTKIETLEKRVAGNEQVQQALAITEEYNNLVTELEELYKNPQSGKFGTYAKLFDQIDQTAARTTKTEEYIQNTHSKLEYVRNYGKQLEEQLALFTDYTMDLRQINRIVEADPEFLRTTRRVKASALQEVNSFVTSMKQYYEALPTIYAKQKFIWKQQKYMKNIHFAQTLNALDILTNPKVTMAEKQSHLFFNAKRLMLIDLQSFGDNVLFHKQIKQLFENEQLLADNHIRLIKNDDKVIVVLDKDFKVTRTAQHERNIKYFVNGEELIRPVNRDLDYDFIFKNDIDVDLDDNVIQESYRKINKQMSKVTNGKHYGTAFEQVNEDFFRHLYARLPEEAKELLPNLEEFVNPLYFSNFEYNHTLLGDFNFRGTWGKYAGEDGKIKFFTPYDMTKAVTETVMRAYDNMDKKMQYITYVLDSELNLANPNNIWSKFTDEQLYIMLKNSPEYTVAVMAKRSFKIMQKEGDRFADFKLTEFYINSPADVAKAREIGASILPMNTYNIAFNVINEFEYMSGFMGVLNKVTNLFKMGYLMSTKNILSNTIDEFRKNVIEQGGFTDASNSLAYSTSAYFKFKKAVHNILKTYDDITEETITEYFKYANKTDASFDEKLFRVIYNFLEEGPVGMVSEVVNNRLQGIKLTAYGRITKAAQWLLTPTAEVDRIMRLSQYLYELKNGSTMLEAMETVKRTHFAFSQKGEFERFAEIVFPFYGFTMDNTSYWLQTLQKHPEYLRYYLNTQQAGINYWDPTGEKRQNNLSYQYALINGQIPITKSGVTLKLAPSYMDVFQLFYTTGEALVNKTAGYIKEPFNVIKHLSTGEPYTAQELGQAVSNLIPIIGTLPNRLLTATKNYKRTENMLNAITPSVFGAIKSFEPRTFQRKVYPKKVYPKKTSPKKAYFTRVWKKSYYNKFYNKYYGSHNVYYKKTYNRLPKRVYYKHLHNVYYDLYTKTGKARMNGYLMPTTSKNLAYKLRYMQRYVMNR